MFFFSLECKSSLNQNDEHDLTKSETERFLTSLNLSTCKCFNTKLPTIKTNAKHSLTNDDDNDLSVTSLNKKKIKRTTIKRMIISYNKFFQLLKRFSPL